MFRRRTAALAVLCIVAVSAVGAPAGAASKGSAPKAPTNLRITASTANSVSLAWDPSSGGSGTWWYVVSCSGSFRVDPPTTTFTRTGLWPGTTFNCFVYTVDKNGHRSASSNVVTFSTPPDTTPPTSPTLTAHAVTPTRVLLTWTRSTDNASQVWYTLLQDGSQVGTAELIGERGNWVLDLQPSTTYRYVVRVRDYFGNTNYSNELVLDTPSITDTVPPSPPANVGGFAGGCPEAWLSWDPATDNVDDTSTILYEVYANGVLNDRFVGGTNTIAYVNEAVVTFVIVAVDSSGNRSGPSNEFVLHVC